MSKMTPMMQQYHDIKRQYGDYILFFRLGDFYEMFFDDAITASKALDITLTKRQAGGGEYAPLCGVPYHSADGYLATLVEKGYKVAICEQVEDPALAKGIVKREVVRLVTPGTITDPATLCENSNNFIASVADLETEIGLAYTDITTGEMTVKAFTCDAISVIVDEIRRNQFAEIVLPDTLRQQDALFAAIENLSIPLSFRDKRYFSSNHARAMLRRTYGEYALTTYDLEDKPAIVVALGGLLSYIFETQKIELDHFQELKYESDHAYMTMDYFTRANLELIETMRKKENKGALLWVVDRTKTAMGGRMMRRWLEQPLIDKSAILARQAAVAYFVRERIVRSELTALLNAIYDFERLLSKAVFGSLNPRDVYALKQSLAALPSIEQLLKYSEDDFLIQKLVRFHALDALFQKLDDAIQEDPPFSVREGGIFKDGYRAELDELRAVKVNGVDWLLKIESEQREKTDIKNLKIGYNKVFGYYIEVSKGNVSKVPEHFQRKQTLANAERYIIPELKEIEDKIIGADERINKLEYQLFQAIRQEIVAHSAAIKGVAQDVATIDCLAALGDVAQRYDYCQPQFNDDHVIEIEDGRHPVVEQIVSDGAFIANDALLNDGDNLITIITGPNMAGKSTYLRQIALNVILAQIGSFVPAARANLCIVDRVFTRVGASDDLFRGQSTFMVEMQELSTILRYATPHSLILLDEIGRGTSTYDGLSIAWAVVEYIANQLHSKTIFATHYHELTELESVVKGVINCLIDVAEEGDQITFLRKIKRGRAGRSFGIEVAKLAGVPSAVVTRAKQILKSLEASDIARKGVSTAVHSGATTAPKRESAPDNPLLAQLQALDGDNLTPIEALNILHDLIRKAKQSND